MGHKCSYSGRIEFENNQLVRIVNASYENMKGTISFSEDVYKEYEDGQIKGRYLDWTYGAGYIVNFPGEKVNYHGYRHTQPESLFVDYNKCNIFGYSAPIPFAAIAKKRPELKYLLKKMDSKIDCETFIKVINYYKKHQNIEELVRLKLYSIALNKNLQKLSRSKMKEVINFIKKNKDSIDSSTTLINIQQCIKYKCSPEQLPNMKACKYNMTLYKYLEKIGANYSYYEDYINMCKKLNKNLEDSYWKYPSDLIDAHEKVAEEIDNMKAANDYSKTEKLKLVTKNLIKNNSIKNGYQLFIPNEMKEIRKQARILNQCLLTAGYDEKMLKQKAILVFIRKDDEPIATVEVFYDKKVGQFYGNERDRNNCKPSPEIEKIFYKWLKTAVIKKKKLEGSNAICV